MLKVPLFLLLILVTQYCKAQENPSLSEIQNPAPKILEDSTKNNSKISVDEHAQVSYSDGVLFKDGIMWLITNHQLHQLQNDITMTNGTKVMNNGCYMPKGGAFIEFKKGENMDMNGIITQVK